MLNSFQLIANVGKDADFNAAKKNCTFTACYTESYKKGDEWVNVPHWFFVVFRSEHAEAYAKKITKGLPVVIEGQIKTYEKEGVKNFFIDARSVRSIEKKAKEEPKRESKENLQAKVDSMPASPSSVFDTNTDDDSLPF
jgi:single-stranded DNA-binding protein